MTRDGNHREPGRARLPVLCAVLLGLLLMHGSPASAASGCHSAMVAPAGPAGPAVTASPGTAPGLLASRATAMATAPAHAAALKRVSTGRGPKAAGVGGRVGAGGASCLATAARSGPHLSPPAVPALAVPPAVAATGRSGRPWVPGRRGPPGGGRDLLLRVCVART